MASPATRVSRVPAGLPSADPRGAPARVSSGGSGPSGVGCGAGGHRPSGEAAALDEGGAGGPGEQGAGWRAVEGTRCRHARSCLRPIPGLLANGEGLEPARASGRLTARRRQSRGRRSSGRSAHSRRGCAVTSMAACVGGGPACRQREGRGRPARRGTVQAGRHPPEGCGTGSLSARSKRRCARAAGPSEWDAFRVAARDGPEVHGHGGIVGGRRCLGAVEAQVRDGGCGGPDGRGAGRLAAGDATGLGERGAGRLAAGYGPGVHGRGKVGPLAGRPILGCTDAGAVGTVGGRPRSGAASPAVMGVSARSRRKWAMAWPVGWVSGAPSGLPPAMVLGCTGTGAVGPVGGRPRSGRIEGGHRRWS
jgi:hypothetical protein